MNSYKKLNKQEKDIIFENIWNEYNKDNKFTDNIYLHIIIAAMILFSIVILSTNYSDKTNYNKTNISNNILDYDIYDDKEIIFDDSINSMTENELDNIVAQL